MIYFDSYCNNLNISFGRSWFRRSWSFEPNSSHVGGIMRRNAPIKTYHRDTNDYRFSVYLIAWCRQAGSNEWSTSQVTNSWNNLLLIFIAMWCLPWTEWNRLVKTSFPAKVHMFPKALSYLFIHSFIFFYRKFSRHQLSCVRYFCVRKETRFLLAENRIKLINLRKLCSAKYSNSRN